MYFVYILRCADGSYYTGSTEDLEQRLAMHRDCVFLNAYTRSRLPVELVWSEAFDSHDTAFHCERQIKGWSRAKKEALIHGDWASPHALVAGERNRREHKR